jgi:uncharacterized phage protein gp47/JayE
MVDYNEILSTMENAYKEKAGFVPDEYSDQGIKFRVLAGELFNFSSQLDFLEKQMFPTTATGKYLDYHCAERGVTRKQGAKATGSVFFTLDSPTESTLLIPKGTVVSTSGENPLRFVTTRNGYVSVGGTFAIVDAEAESVGKKYNIAIKKIATLVSQVPGVYSVTNKDAFEDGEDIETDEELRSRLMYIYKHHNNGTNIAFYKSLAESMDGVYSAGVVPKNRGAGTVDIFISKKGEMADATLASNVQRVTKSMVHFLLTEINRDFGNKENAFPIDNLVFYSARYGETEILSLEDIDQYDITKAVNKFTLATNAEHKFDQMIAKGKYKNTPRPNNVNSQEQYYSHSQQNRNDDIDRQDYNDGYNQVVKRKKKHTFRKVLILIIVLSLLTIGFVYLKDYYVMNYGNDFAIESILHNLFGLDI